jgi:hypothetical protein
LALKSSASEFKRLFLVSSEESGREAWASSKESLMQISKHLTNLQHNSSTRVCVPQRKGLVKAEG